MSQFAFRRLNVVRAGLDLFEIKAMRVKKIRRWQQAAKAVAENSKSVNKEFQNLSSLKKYDHSQTMAYLYC
jgi:hypothetical protein